LKIDLPEEGWICLKAEVKYAKPEFGFAVSFVDVPRDAANRLRQGILRRQGLPVEAGTDTSPVTPAIAANTVVTSETSIDDTASILQPGMRRWIS
jgi:hypothetical protein